MLWSANRLRKVIWENENWVTDNTVKLKKMFFQSYSKLQLLQNVLNQKAKITIICFGFNSTCERGVEKHLKAMSAFFAREGG